MKRVGYTVLLLILSATGWVFMSADGRLPTGVGSIEALSASWPLSLLSEPVAESANAEAGGDNTEAGAASIDTQLEAAAAKTFSQALPANESALASEAPESVNGVMASRSAGANPEGDASSDSDDLDSHADLVSNAEADIRAADVSENWQSPSEQQQQIEQNMSTASNGEIELSEPLNLKLPELEWNDQLAYDNSSQKLLGNVFQQPQEKQSAMDMSGKIYWDESEEAETKPLRDTITGGEVELKILLP